MIRHGAVTQQLGYSLGELVWTARRSPNPNLLEIDEELRTAASRGRPPGVTWVKAGVKLDGVSAIGLTTSSRRYRRVVVNDGAPAAASPGAPAPAPVAASPVAQPPSVSPVRSAGMAGFPTAEEVLRRVVGSDALDTTARQAAAFLVLEK